MNEQLVGLICLLVIVLCACCAACFISYDEERKLSDAHHKRIEAMLERLRVLDSGVRR